MTPCRWIITGWALLAATLLLAVLSLIWALGAVDADVRVLPAAPPPLVDVRRLLVAVIFAVLAGAAFFAGLACFFWSALRESRRQTARVLELLDPPQ